LKLRYDESLSNFAFKLKLRRYSTVDDLGAIAVIAVFFAKGLVIPYMVGRCRLTPG
jgi:Na+/H+ antiporter NhaA